MIQGLQFRGEADSDLAAIAAVTQEAFRGRPFAAGDEADVIDRLRAKGALSLSMVAMLDQAIVGQITFSPALCDDAPAPWYALGPVSVVPEYQGQGIGSELIRRGLAELQNKDALGCMLTGNPAYYQRFGFRLAPEHCPENEPREYFMIKPFGSDTPTGLLRFHEAFYSAT